MSDREDNDGADDDYGDEDSLQDEVDIITDEDEAIDD